MSAGKDWPLDVGIKEYDGFVEEFKNVCDKIELAGSCRRGCKVIHDVDIVIIAKPVFTVMLGIEADRKHFQIKQDDGPTLDIYFATEEDFGSQLQMWTGPVSHNISLRAKAKSLGMKLSQYGITEITGNLYKCSREEQVYNKLGILGMPLPENRR